MSHSQFHSISSLYLDMHGLIFETSIWLLAGSTRLLSSLRCSRTGLASTEQQLRSQRTMFDWSNEHTRHTEVSGYVRFRLNTATLSQKYHAPWTGREIDTSWQNAGWTQAPRWSKLSSHLPPSNEKYSRYFYELYNRSQTGISIS